MEILVVGCLYNYLESSEVSLFKRLLGNICATENPDVTRLQCMSEQHAAYVTQISLNAQFFMSEI